MTTAPVKKKGAAKGHKKWGGRKKGTPNKITADVQAALLESANIIGGKDALVGYFQKVWQFNPDTHAGLMKSLIPLQIKGSITGKIEHIHSTMTQKEAIEAYSRAIGASGAQLIEAKAVEIKKEKDGGDE